MSEQDIPRILPMDDDVTSFPADEARLRTFQEASDALSRFEVPRLVDPANPHQKLQIAALLCAFNSAPRPLTCLSESPDGNGSGQAVASPLYPSRKEICACLV